ncbi:MAG: ATP-binding protein [Butyrivibrio sp.]|nr:ATP-binding protein [Butyrivibrio sp.]
MAMTDTEYIMTAARQIILRVDEYLTGIGSNVFLSSYPTLEREVSKLTEDKREEWAKVEAVTKEDITTEPSCRYVKALGILGDDSVLQTLLDLCIAGYFFPEFFAYIKDGFGYDTCIHIAALLEGKEEITYGEIKKYVDMARRLMVIDLKKEPLQYIWISADTRLIGFLSGEDTISPKLSDFTVMYRPEDEIHEPFVNQDIIERGATLFEGGCRVVCLSGIGGRRFIARHIAKKIGKVFVFLNIADLVWHASDGDISFIRDALIREACISDAGICIYGFSKQFIIGESSDNYRGRRDMEILRDILLVPIINEGIRLILCVDDIKLLPRREDFIKAGILSLPENYSFEKRKKLWRGIFDLYEITLDADSFAARYRMIPREVANAALNFMEESAGGDKNKKSEELFVRINIESIHNANEMCGRIIYSDVKLEDVKLKTNSKMILKDTVNAVFRGPLIMDEWNLKTIYPYGRGVSLLMSGPPGTGKTMSANAIAGELSLPLYQVNLSNVIDKYIGETEKNLEKAFTFAEKHSVVLFFDEADALFGTRGKVNDSMDRYANNEIAYLLQRMESYEGVVLMATNIKGNIDPAFMRRIRYVVHFEKPDEEMRKQIWNGCLKDTVPYKDIDVDYLASQFDTHTGSIIKTVFLNACALAASDGELTMKHVIRAIKQEIEKEKTVGFEIDTLGKYAYLA